VLDFVQHLIQAAVGGQVGSKRLFEVSKLPAQRVLVDLAVTVLFFVFDDEQGAVIAQ